MLDTLGCMSSCSNSLRRLECTRDGETTTTIADNADELDEVWIPIGRVLETRKKISNSLGQVITCNLRKIFPFYMFRKSPHDIIFFITSLGHVLKMQPYFFFLFVENVAAFSLLFV